MSGVNLRYAVGAKRCNYAVAETPQGPIRS